MMDGELPGFPFVSPRSVGTTLASATGRPVTSLTTTPKLWRTPMSLDRPTRSVLAALGVATLLLAACGPGTAEESAVPAAESATTEQPATTEAPTTTEEATTTSEAEVDEEAAESVDEAEQPVPIEIISEAEITWIAENEFHFRYFTNDVCGSGNFVVRDKETGEVIGTFEGEEGCWGPKHGGFPAASNYFGEFVLLPETTYIVTETVRGTADGPPDGDNLAPGTGTAVIEFEVTTMPVGGEWRLADQVQEEG